MYLSCLIDTLACPSWSAPIRPDRPSSSIKVATVLRNECDVDKCVVSVEVAVHVFDVVVARWD